MTLRVISKMSYEPEMLRTLALVEAAKRAELTIVKIRLLLLGFADEVGAS